MQLKLNRDFALRHLGVAALMAALCGWFCYDGAVKYPSLDDAAFREQVNHGEALKPDTRQNAIDRQFQFSGITGLAALVIAFGVWRAKRKTLVWDDKEMCGSLTGGKPLAFAAVASVDRSKWETKSIATLVADDGRRVVLDAWHHAGVKDLLKRFDDKTSNKY